MDRIDIPLETQLRHLRRLASDSLCLWDIPRDSVARLLNVSENVTFLVEAPGGFRAVLRVHREDYHSRQAIESELAWIAALGISRTVSTPGCYPGRNGQALQVARSKDISGQRYMVLFHFVEGVPPDKSGNLIAGFEELGEIAARMHLQAGAWVRPAGFIRMSWDLDRIFGASPVWGDWRDAPGVNREIRGILEKTEFTIRNRLEAYGYGPDRYGLIHADMRFANLLTGQSGTSLIDFDDCGFGWFLYDFAAAVSFVEDDPRLGAFRSAWLRGYRKFRTLDDTETDEINTFVMLRRMALLAWIGSHIEAPEPQAHAPRFASNTAVLARDYLRNFS